jgi:hypothetical protein
MIGLIAEINTQRLVIAQSVPDLLSRALFLLVANLTTARIKQFMISVINDVKLM